MLNKENLSNIFAAVLAPLAAAAVVWGLLNISTQKVDAGFIALSLLTVFSSCFLRFKLPKVDLQLTISDALVLIALLLYGGSYAVLLVTVESVVFSLLSRDRSKKLDVASTSVHFFVAPLAVFAAANLVPLAFGNIEIIKERADFTGYILLLSGMAVAIFAVRSLLTALHWSLKTGSPFLEAWKGTAVNSSAAWIIAACLSAVIVKALEQVDLVLFSALVGFFGIIYLTFRRFVEDMTGNVEQARHAERDRAEQAEKHVKELEQYVADLEHSSEALQESHEAFRHAAYHDALTGLPNRNYFLDTLKGLLQQSRDRSESNFAVLFLDLRSFKTINDSLGHSLGDRLIKHVASRLEEMIRDADMVARFSGDKFGIILNDLLSRDEATGFADRLATRLEEPYTLDGRQVFTSAKIGIAYGNSKYPEAEDILRDADIAMYYAKDNEDNYVIFDQKMHIRAVTRLQLETDLRFAIEREEFELFYQPIVALETATLVGFEALVRWNHPQRGLIPPNEFIPVSESTGLIVPMTVQILEKACSQTVKWQNEYGRENPLTIAVNLSGKHFGHPDLVEQINSIIAKTGISPSGLKLELTESAVMDNAETAILMLKEIKKTGVQISIDDFGTGYSSLSYLHRFPIDLLKVDRSFVSAMEENSENGEIVRTVIALAKALRLKVVAEGIESIHQFHQLKILGCEYGQGYLFSKPLPVGDIDKLLADKTRWQNILPPSSLPLQQSARDLPHLRLAQ